MVVTLERIVKDYSDAQAWQRPWMFSQCTDNPRVCDSSGLCAQLLNELLQNADDAESSEFKVCHHEIPITAFHTL